VSGDVKIEKYPGHVQAHVCDRCGFQTLKLEREEITKEATENGEGELIKHYRCSYCKRIKRRVKTIARLSETAETYQLPDKLVFKDEAKGINLIEIKIHTGDGNSSSYDFPNTSQASKFLEEFQIEESEEEL